MWHPWPAGLSSLVVEATSTLLLLRLLAYLVKHSTRPAGRQVESAFLVLALLSGAWAWVVLLGTALVIGPSLITHDETSN